MRSPNRFLLLIVSLSFCLPTRAPASGYRSLCASLVAGDFSRAEDFPVHADVAPKTIDELRTAIRTTNRPVAVRGAGFSMGGQTAAAHGVVVDMKNLNQVLEFDPVGRTIRVQAGATWAQIQKVIDPHDLAIQIMQSYNNFQVGGSLSVNAHGRYNGYGPLISSVQEITVLLADGSIAKASRTENPDLFAGAIGGYAALGIILDAKLTLVENSVLERRVATFSNTNIEAAVGQFIEHFDRAVRGNQRVELINADIFPPDYDTVSCVTFEKTERAPTISERLQSEAAFGWNAFLQAAGLTLEQNFSHVKWVRGRLVAPMETARELVVHRNWEASYDNRWLMPLNERIPLFRHLFPFSNRKALLQEYFIPKSKLPSFIARMKKVFVENGVNVSNVSLRYVPQNTESILSWSKEESFAVVVYYTQPYHGGKAARLAAAKEWTRKMIAEVEAAGGSFYLPYQVYANRDQFNRAYPRAAEFFALKAKFDPTGKFNNNLWEQYRLSQDTYFYRELTATEEGRKELEDYFTNIFSINDPHRFIAAIQLAMENTARNDRDLNDRNIYDELLKVLPQFANGWKTKLASTLGALRVQQREMADQTRDALHEVGMTRADGYVEIGFPGRYVLPLRERLPISGKIYAVNPTFTKIDLFESSWGLRVPAVVTSRRLELSDYDMFLHSEIPTASVDLVTMYIGLHHCPPEKLAAFVASIYRVLRPGGKFVLRDHDADEKLLDIAFIAHSTYNAGLGIPYGDELQEIRNLHPLTYWKDLLARAGLKNVGSDRHQAGDPTGNTLMVFEKERAPEAGALAGVKAPYSELNLLPGYHRDQSYTYMTQAEWFLVDIFNEMSAFVQHSPWYRFPYEEFIALYDQVYAKHKAFAEHEGVGDLKAFALYDQMDRFLLLGIKGLFKAMNFMATHTKSEVSSAASEPYFVRAQWFMAKFFREYSEFMTHTPWYQFPYRDYLARLEAYVKSHRAMADTGGAISAERVEDIDRILVSQCKKLLMAMQLAADLIAKFMGEQVADPNTQFLLRANEAELSALPEADRKTLTALGDDLYHAETVRYVPFTAAMLNAARAGAQVVNVAGNSHISIIFSSSSETLPALPVGHESIFTYRYPTHTFAQGCQDYFHTIRVEVGDLPKLLTEMPALGLNLLRVHDY